MSKKLIAVAAAAALALTGLVGVAPANASSALAITTSGGFIAATGDNDGTTAAKPATLEVPDTNTLDTSADTAGTLEITAAADATVEITTTGAVKVLRSVVGVGTAGPNVNVSTLGSTSAKYTAKGDSTDDSYIFTTSTEVGSATVKITTDTTSFSKTVYVKAVPGDIHTLKNVTAAPATLAKGAKATIAFEILDVFGNAIPDLTVNDNDAKTSISTSEVVRATGTGITNGYDTVSKTYKWVVTSSTTDPFVVTVDLAQGDAELGLPDNKDTYVAVVNNTGVAAQVATLTAQIATMRPKATSVTKKRYNTLARKWNAAFPSQKVALKK
jgi:hypothetical protein